MPSYSLQALKRKLFSADRRNWSNLSGSGVTVED
nr:MAG TPA: hypothetical protein [Caudoviricetes sp.]